MSPVKVAIVMAVRFGAVRFAAVWMAVVSMAVATIGFVEAAFAEPVRLAVAANVADAAREIARRFEATSGHTVVISTGATGQLYAQISQGAPFDVLLAADTETPARLVTERLAIAGSAFTYAVGTLVLYSRDARIVDGAATLREARFARLAIANPETAPYGRAAIETMTALGVIDRLRPKLVQGNSIAQTFQFVDTGSAEVGFVALAQVVAPPQVVASAQVVAAAEGVHHRPGSRWVVPSTLHRAIEQGAVLLTAGRGNRAAEDFLVFLRSPEARGVLETFGYTSGGRPSAANP